MYGALIVAKQVFKWGYQEGKLREYRLAAAKVAKAKAQPQPCFTTEQVEMILTHTIGVEQAAFATLAYAGLRIGEVEQLQWIDVKMKHGELGMFHICRGGSNGTTKNKDSRFVPIHPRVCPLLQALPRRSHVFPDITERKLLGRLKAMCKQLGFDQPQQYKLHTFRHHFASVCANHQVAYRKALTWLGHSSSQILDLYYHLHDADSQAAMKSLAADGLGWCWCQNVATAKITENLDHDVEGNLRAIGGSTIEKLSQDHAEDDLVKALIGITERAGFEPAVRGIPPTTV